MSYFETRGLIYTVAYCCTLLRLSLILLSISLLCHIHILISSLEPLRSNFLLHVPQYAGEG